MNVHGFTLEAQSERIPLVASIIVVSKIESNEHSGWSHRMGRSTPFLFVQNQTNRFFLECDWTHRRWARKNGHLPPPLVGLSNKIKPQGDAFSLKERQILDGLAGGVPIRLCFVVGLMFWLFFFLLAELIWVMTVISLSRRIQPREPPDDPQYKLYVTIFGIPSQHQPIIGSINRNRFLGVFFSNNSL